MITAPANFVTANNALNKKPILLVQIAGYSRAFSTPSLGVVAGLSVSQSSGVTAGNLIFVFAYNASSEATASLTISDTGSNTWNLIYQDTYILGWWAVANVSATITISVSGSVFGHIAGGNCEIYAIEVPAAYAGFAAAGAAGSGSPASITAGSTTISFPVNAASAWNLILVELAPAVGPNSPVALLFARCFLSGVGGTIPGVLEIIGAAAAQVYGAGIVNAGVVIQTGSVIWDFGGTQSFPTSFPMLPASYVTPSLVSVDPLSETVSDLDGGSDLSDLVFTVQDTAQLITADFPNFTFEGKQVILSMGFQGLALVDYLPLFTGKIDTVSSDNNNLEYKFTCPDIRKDLSKVIYVTGDDGFATSSDHPKTISAHPLDILVDILENQVGWPASIIDIAKITQWRNTIYSGLTFKFTITSPPAAKDFIENEIMKPLGAYHRTNNLGIFTVNFFYPINPQPVATLNHGTMTAVPEAQQAELVNQCVFRFDYSTDDKALTERVIPYAPSVAKYGLFGEHIIEAKGLRSAFGGSFMAAIVSRLIFLRYALKQLLFGGEPNLWWECVLEPGDIVSVTSSIVPDRDLGVLGITAKSFEILDRTWDVMNGIASFKLLAVDLSKFKQFLITPNGEADFTAASTLDKGKYLFLSDAADKYSDGSNANTMC